jgi:hypothetical protein
MPKQSVTIRLDASHLWHLSLHLIILKYHRALNYLDFFHISRLSSLLYTLTFVFAGLHDLYFYCKSQMY